VNAEAWLAPSQVMRIYETLHGSMAPAMLLDSRRRCARIVVDRLERGEGL
jgi:hypothetical protein